MKKRIEIIIKELNRCASQNEKDAKSYDPWEDDNISCLFVAKEQRRMIKILKALIK